MYISGPMARVQLYVRSKRATMITRHAFSHGMGNAQSYQEGSTVAKLPREDAYARDLLKSSGVDFELVDLSAGIGPRLRARLQGVRQTPTLLDRDRSPQLYAGMKEISDYVTEHKNTRPS